MNELNYASLEASKRLVDNGIVLETDRYWEYYDPCSKDDPATGHYGFWRLVDYQTDIPAPSIAHFNLHYAYRR